jgi:hypothetical protein
MEVNAEKVRHLAKSGDSTETMETEEMLEATDRSEASQDSFDEYKDMVDDFNERMGPDSEQQHHALAPSDNHATITDDENTNSKEEQQSRSPYDIAKYKAEIWYPECRDCGCCQGFKHGCACCPSNNGVCMCVTGGICVTGSPDDDSVVSMNSYELWCQRLHSQFNPNELQFHPIERQGSRRRLHNGTNTSTGKVNSPCRFFFSAAGCRYGDACPFNHKK